MTLQSDRDPKIICEFWTASFREMELVSNLGGALCASHFGQGGAEESAYRRVLENNASKAKESVLTL